MLILRLFISISILYLLSACYGQTQAPIAVNSSEQKSSSAIALTDASNTQIVLKQEAKKIVCLHLSCIDTLAELDIPPIAVHNGLHDLAVSSAYFDSAQNVVKVAGYAEPNLEQLLFLNPDLVVGHVAQLASQRQQIEAIAPLYVLDIETAEDAIENLKIMGQITGETKQAEAAIQAFQEKLETYKNRSPKNKTVLVTNGTTGNFFVATDRSLVGSVLAEVANYPSSFSDLNLSAINWIALSQEEILKINPDVIFVLTSAPSNDFLEQLQSDPFWQSLKAVQTQQIYQIENDKVGGLTTGTRSLLRLLDEIMPKLYPDQFSESSNLQN
ncbi:MAG: ABC transporter substrate-binding protein [Spirulinaceae cyanobacterium]